VDNDIDFDDDADPGTTERNRFDDNENTVEPRVIDELPDLHDPHKLSVDGVRLLRDLFSDAAIVAAREGDAAIASWARTICEQYSRALNQRTESARVLQHAIAEYRVRHPYGEVMTQPSHE
jgi:hypothetical protein